MSTNPKRSRTNSNPSPVQVSFTLPQPSDVTNDDLVAIERQKLQLDRERLRMDKEKHEMDKQKHQMKQKIRQAQLQKLRAETALAKASAASTKLATFDKLATLGMSPDKMTSMYTVHSN